MLGMSLQERSNQMVGRGIGTLAHQMTDEKDMDWKKLNQSFFSAFPHTSFLNRSILPAVSKNFCFPVKKG